MAAVEVVCADFAVDFAVDLAEDDWAVAGRTVSSEQAVSPRMREVKRPRRICFSLLVRCRALIANGREVTPEGVPVSVPELMAAAVVDSLLAAAIAAIFEATALATPPDVDGVVVLIEELGLVLVLELAALLLLPPVLLFELTNCPADVGNTAEAPEPAEVEGDVDSVDVAAAAVAGAAVDPRRGTDAAAPVEPALM